MTLDPGAAFGFLMNAIAWTAIIVAIPTGWIIRRIGPKPTLIISGVITALGMAGVALFFNVSYEMFLTFRVITGIGVGMCSVTGPTAVSLWFSNKHRFMAVAIWIHVGAGWHAVHQQRVACADLVHGGCR